MESDYASELSRLRRELSEVERSLEGVRHYLDSIHSRLEKIESRLSANERAVSVLRETLAGLDGSLKAVSSAIAEIGRKVDLMRQGLISEFRNIISSETVNLRDEMRAGLSSVDRRLSEIQKRSNELNERVAALDKNFTNFGERIESGMKILHEDLSSSLSENFKNLSVRLDEAFKGVETLIRTQDKSLRGFIEEQSNFIRGVLKEAEGDLIEQIERNASEQRNLIGEVRRSVDRVYDALRPLEDRLQKRIEETTINLREHVDKRTEELSRRSEESYKKLEAVVWKSAEELQGLLFYHQSYEEGRVASRDLELIDLLYAVLKRLEYLETRLAEIELRGITR